ncbi:MAG: hypothetical protein K0S33_2523 [Bacteroidetes bacterium]|jgi:methylthioribose-1-phosphate isomerase|nr:hypothetical protein [Bacteroidota bacterium]
MSEADTIGVKFESEKREVQVIIQRVLPSEEEVVQQRKDRFMMYGINFLLLITAVAIGFIFFKKRKNKQ